MKPLSSKQKIRIEKKKKKMAALLQISKLNEYDRAAKNARANTDNAVKEENCLETEPSPKRLRTDRKENKTNAVIQQINVDFSPNQQNSDVPPQLGPSGKPKLQGEEFSRLKQQLREKTKKMRDQPTFRLREFGELASFTTDVDNRMPLFLCDIQHLIMYSQIGMHSPYTPARWCQLEKYSKVTHTNVLVFENISAYHFVSNESRFPFLSSTFTHKLELVSPEAYKADVVQDFSMVPVTGTQMRKFIDQFGSLEEAVTKSDEVFDLVKNLFTFEKDSSEVKQPEKVDKSRPPSDKFPRTQLLLSGWQLVEENFPLPIKGLMERKYPGYVLTKDVYKEVTPFSPMFGVDCEMCRTAIGDLELTRVSIVDEKLEVFYEQLVKPDHKITDYLTRFSGITAKMMKNVKKRLPEVQNDIRNLLPADAILVGQSLSNDMHALKMMHPYVIDTSVIYNITGHRTRKSKLQTLSRYFLNERIQESTQGHCSIEDSLASIKLAQHKLANSLCYGDVVMSGVKEHFKKHPELGNANYATSMLKHTTRMEKTAQVIGVEETAARYKYYTSKGSKNYDANKINFAVEKSNNAVIKRLCDTSMQYTLNVAHVKISDEELAADQSSVLQTVDDWVKRVYEHTAVPGLNVVIFGGRGSGSGCCFIQLRRLPY